MEVLLTCSFYNQTPKNNQNATVFNRNRHMDEVFPSLLYTIKW